MSPGEKDTKNKKQINKVLSYITSLEGQRVILTIVAVFLITLILCSRYFAFQSVVSNGVSKQEIAANKTIEVIDQEATKKKKKEAAAIVKSVFKPVEGNINDVLLKNLIDQQNLIAQIRQEISNDKSKAYRLDELIRNTPLEKIDSSTIRYLLVVASDYNWKNIKKETNTIVKKILKHGISQKELSGDKINIIKTYLPRSVSNENQSAIIELVNISVNKPNIIIDKNATELAKRNAMEAVEPVKMYFRKGQVVVYEGQQVTPLQLEALNKLGYTVNKMNWLLAFGMFCLVLITVYLVWYYLSRFEPKYANSVKHLALLVTLAIVSVIIPLFIPHIPNPFNLYEMPMYLFPIPAVALIIAYFTNSRMALLTTSMIILLISVAYNFSIDVVSVLAVGVIVAVFKSGETSYFKDSSLIECGIAVGLAQVLVVLSNFFIISNVFDVFDLQELIFKIVVAMIAGFATGAITIAALPHLEAIFKIITSHGLMELSDHNQPLLRRLQYEAPGTYHHSLMVSTLAEAAAEAIGASTILVRVGAFYHDVGKLKRPSFFIENQSYFGAENPHDKLNPRLSKMVLTAHTKDGYELAKQYNMPEEVQNIILEHHGEGIMMYFYLSALESEGSDKVIKDQFRYAGPKPQTKESAIVMLADATESAVRSLNNPGVTEVEEMVNKIVSERLQDGQLSESPLTLKDISVISSTFIRVLRGMQHHRIEYHENALEELDTKNKMGKQKQEKISTSQKLKEKLVEKPSDNQQNQPENKDKAL